jgi:aminoglycoside 6'-N-acetyltransferase I
MTFDAVRSFRADDHAEYVRMRAALWPEADRQELATEATAMLADPDLPAYVAERAGGGLCGFIEASIRPWAEGVDEQPCAFVEGWWVDDDMRGTGIGRRLMAAVEDWARARGFTELGSDTDLGNLGAQHAHRALGFVERSRNVYFRKLL